MKLEELKTSAPKDIDELISRLKKMWGVDKVKVDRDDKFTHIYEINTPHSWMKIFILGEDKPPIEYSGAHESAYLTPYYRKVPATRDAKTLGFWWRRELQLFKVKGKE